MHKRRHEKPIRRTNPSGREAWVARWTDRAGKRHSAGTFPLKGPCRAPGEDCCAQHAIDAAYDREARTALRSSRPDLVGSYAATWTQRRPRSERTNEGYNMRLRSVLDVELDGKALRDWRMADVGRRQVNDLIGHLLVVQGRAHRGAQVVLAALSAMWQDARDDEIVEVNPFYGAKVKAADPRIVKATRAVRVWPWEEMHRFAAVAATVTTGVRGTAPIDAWRPTYAEAMVRVLSDCGLRLGEMLGLYREDYADGMLRVRRTAYRGRLLPGTKTDRGTAAAGRVVPVPAGLGALLDTLPPRIAPPLLFTTPSGCLWREPDFYKLIWYPTQAAAGIDARPHEFRHSYVSLVRPVANIDDADLAAVAGHTVATMHDVYTHSLGRSFEAIRAVVDAG
jgi:integrase